MTSADIVHEFQAYSHLGEKRGGGTLIFSNIRRPGPFLGLTFWYFVMTPKDIHKIFIPQKFFIFLKNPQRYWNSKFWIPKWCEPTYEWKYYSTPPPPSTLSSQIETGAGGVQTQITEKKTLIRVFIVGFFATILYFFTVQKGRNIYRGGGGGGATFYFFFFFFFWGGGGGLGGGVQILISIESYITCDFSGGGGGGVRTTYPSLDSRIGKK